MKKFEKIFFSMIAMIMMVTVGSVFTSCTNDDDDFPVTAHETQLDQALDQDSVAPMTRAANSSYKISESRLAYFVHYCQKNAGPQTTNYPDGEGLVSSSVASTYCCPDSYMMAAACLAHYKDGYSTSYNATGTKLVGIASGANSYYPYNYEYLLCLYNYCNGNDYSFLNATKTGSSSTSTHESSRSATKTFIENALSNNRFVMVNVNVYGSYDNVNATKYYSTSSSTNNDLTTSPTYITSNDESTSGVYGHIILIIGIETNSTGDGIVTYIDPLAKTRSGGASNRRYVRYSNLLNSVLYAGNNSNYDAISIGLN